MKVHHIKRIWSRPLFMKWGNHYCPVCNGELKKVKVSRIVNSKSEEAKDYDFSTSGEGYMNGNVKFIWTEFTCTKCSQNYSVNDIYQLEKQTEK